MLTLPASRPLFVISACLVMIASSCVTAAAPAVKPPVQNVLKAEHISPRGGISLKNALALIDGFIKPYLRVQGDYQADLVFTELTTKEIWENNGVQVFRCAIAPVEVDGIAVFRNGKYQCFMVGKEVESVLAADINGNGRYNICVNAVIRSSDVMGEVKIINDPWILIYHDPAKEMEHHIVVMFEPGRQIKMAVSVDGRESRKDVMIRPNDTTNAVDVYIKRIDQPDAGYRLMGPLTYGSMSYLN